MRLAILFSGQGSQRVEHWQQLSALAVGELRAALLKGLPQLAVRHVLEGIEVLVLGGNLDAAAPAAGAVEILAVGVGYLRAIDHNLVIVKALVLGP